MSQKEVFQIIKELGGEATYREIKNRAKEKYPHLSLYSYIGNRLSKLMKWGYIEFIKDCKYPSANDGKYKIISEYD